MPLTLLVVSSETPDQQDQRRRRTGQASHETYADTLRDLTPGCTIRHMSCIDGTPPLMAELKGVDGALFPGSPIQMHEESAESRAAAAFMVRVFEVGLPSFGSCAGLQIAAVAAGGTTKVREGRMEAGFARRIVASEPGRNHPMLAGRPATWDAPAMHASIVDRLPDGATVLASAPSTPVEAAEIRQGSGIFWGVQYHPELSLGEIADALRRQSDDLIAQGLAEDASAVQRYAASLETLHRAPERRDLAWQLGLDAEVTDAAPSYARNKQLSSPCNGLRGGCRPQHKLHSTKDLRR